MSNNRKYKSENELKCRNNYNCPCECPNCSDESKFKVFGSIIDLRVKKRRDAWNVCYCKSCGYKQFTEEERYHFLFKKEKKG